MSKTLLFLYILFFPCNAVPFFRFDLKIILPGTKGKYDKNKQKYNSR